MSISNTSICNMALGRIGAERINNYDDASDTKPEAIQCRLHYEQTRDGLLRFHQWRFARARATLSADTASPAFEWDYAYILPVDFLAMRTPYDVDQSGTETIHYSYALEGNRLLSNENSMEIRYIKKVEDPTQFDPLFVEVLVLQLALKMVMPLTGGGGESNVMRRELYNELWGTPRQPGLMQRVLAMDKQETNTTGQNDMGLWNDARIAVDNDPMHL
jgi:hypothetical protein